MQRRSFLRVSATALGCGAQLAPIAAKALQPLNLVNGQKLFEAINAVPCRLSTQISCFVSCVQTASLPWTTTGYKPALEGIIWMAGDFALLPLQLQHPQYGTLDTVLLVFYQKEKGKWVSSGILSSFQIEAIEQTLEDPSFPVLSPDTPQSIFLPIPKRGLYHADGWAYATVTGYFQVQTQLSTPQHQVRAAAFKDNRIIWQKQFSSSQHLCRQPNRAHVLFGKFLGANTYCMISPNLPTC